MIRFADLPRNVSAWSQAMDLVEIPVLRHTIEELARLRQNEENLIARDIARVLLHDPMFTLRVLRYLQAHRRAAQTADITTIEHALMMLGITPFFEHFADLPAVESTLESQPRALKGLMHVAFRAHHAALYARDWAVLRHDLRADEVAIAALLHDIADLLIWCFAPEMGLQIEDMLRSVEGMRSGAAQSRVLGFKLSDLRTAMIAQWKLAALLQSLMGDMHVTHPRVTNVALAVDLARHSAYGWDDRALPDDYAGIQGFLKLQPQEVLGRIRRVAMEAGTVRDWYQLEAIPIPEDLAIVFPGAQDGAESDDS